MKGFPKRSSLVTCRFRKFCFTLFPGEIRRNIVAYIAKTCPHFFRLIRQLET